MVELKILSQDKDELKTMPDSISSKVEGYGISSIRLDGYVFGAYKTERSQSIIIEISKKRDYLISLQLNDKLVSHEDLTYFMPQK